MMNLLSKNIWRNLVVLTLLLLSTSAQAQIGYQVALINNATGEPRALETVQVELSITDSQENQIYSDTQKATSNDFGIVSLTLGDANTFDNVDWCKLPLFISAKVDDQLISKSQILNVPVAEYAKRTGTLTPEILCHAPFSHIVKHTAYTATSTLTFYPDGQGKYIEMDNAQSNLVDHYYEFQFKWFLDGNRITIVSEKVNPTYTYAEMATYIKDLDGISFCSHLYSR